jgi:hypothetical protein
MSSESSKGPAKSRTRSGGPRTAHGKARSSQNSSKHKIFVAHVLPEEEKDAILLFTQIRKELRLNGPLELRIGRDLVQNELESRRIERFAAQQSLKAQHLADLSEGPLLCKSPFRRPVPAEKECQPGYRSRLSPGFCATNLRVFKNHIESFGPQPDKDLDFLASIYGDEITRFGELIVACYKFFIAPKCTQAGNDKTLD